MMYLSFRCNFLFIVLSYLSKAECGIYDRITCIFREECCSDGYIPGDINKLMGALTSNVYGQHIANDVVIHAIAGHWKSAHARKPLTLSFHGWTGSGKNYISQIIAESMYYHGMQSKYVHLFNAGLHFPELSRVKQYKMELYDKIKTSVQECPRQLFIFDDVHSMPAGVLDVLKPLIDYHEKVDNVDYRQSIFIFLSNTGSKAITQHFLDLWRAGRRRDDIRLADFESLISQGAFNEEGERTFADHVLPTVVVRFVKGVRALIAGGFYHSETIKNNLIDHYVPFLPMEREHVEQCIANEFRIRGVGRVGENLMQEVINFIDWGLSPENKFAKTGCKRLSQKVATVAARITRNVHREL